MDIQFYGANCCVLSSKGVRVVIDDNLGELGLKTVAKSGDILLFTGSHAVSAVDPKIVIAGPGEYEVSGLSITGIAARAHIDEPNSKSATMYRIVADDVTYLITGHIYPDLSEDQLEQIGMIDVMIVPIGGSGFTLDAGGAMQVIKKVEPKLVIPTHYADDALHYVVPQQTLEQALKNMGMEQKETVTKLRFKPAEASDATQLVVLTRS